jgi:hypothetical protein
VTARPETDHAPVTGVLAVRRKRQSWVKAHSFPRFEGANRCEPQTEEEPCGPYVLIPSAGPFAASVNLITALIEELQASGRLG